MRNEALFLYSHIRTVLCSFNSFHFELPCQVPGDDADGDQHVDQFPVFVLREWIVHGKNLLFTGYISGKAVFLVGNEKK